VEPSFVKIRNITLDADTLPNISQAAWLAELCLTLYFRTPRFHRLADRFFSTAESQDGVPEALQHPGVMTLALTIDGGREIVKNCLFNFKEACGTERFWTTDTPCWVWYRDGSEGKPVDDLRLLMEMSQEPGRTATRWICPLTPKYLIEIAPVVEKGRFIHHSRLDDAETQNCNRMILHMAEQFRIRPPGSKITRPGGNVFSIS
jgi:hypothetical protein